MHPLFPGVTWGNLELAPHLLLSMTMELHLNGLKVELIFMGPAHTTNDIVIWVPERKLLFSGDLIFNQGTPFVARGSVSGSLQAVKRLRELGAETIIPGHGSVCGPKCRRHRGLPFHLSKTPHGKHSRQARVRWVQPGDRLGPFADWHDSERLRGTYTGRTPNFVKSPPEPP
ncbi:MAG: hypothetical protein Ct9H300mP11_25420 [Chloroflexota bacterium]|nr:MAG: hypothetical protein Ct9H300mP11_25420 [Chloroflexota bacterium]